MIVKYPNTLSVAKSALFTHCYMVQFNPAYLLINLPDGASLGAISIGPGDNYAYIADSGRGRIYVLDIYPNSASYNQVVETISVDATSGLRQIAISSDGRSLFATATDGYIPHSAPSTGTHSWGANGESLGRDNSQKYPLLKGSQSHRPLGAC